MGTRSLARVLDVDGSELLCIYRQFDGYPSGMGADIKGILKGRVIVNGIGENRHVCNGMGCLAAMLVAGLKRDGEPGGVYVYPVGTNDVGEDYEYTISRGEPKSAVPPGILATDQRHPAEIRLKVP